MAWKIFQTRRIFGSIFKTLKLFHGDEDVNGSSYADLGENPRQLETFNSDAYMVSNQRMLELETQKAFVTSLSRHDRWKAGGPL